MSALQANSLLWQREDDRDPSIKLVGAKAHGLLKLGPEWTPTFFIITTEAHLLWKSNPGSLPSRLLNDGIDQALQHLNASKAIVRSSAVTESLDARGQYESRETISRSKQVIEAGVLIWEHAKSINPRSLVALVVQIYASPERFGHLSNERRVSRRRNLWHCEWVATHSGATKIDRYQVPITSTQPSLSALNCSDPNKLETSLRTVASYSAHQETRCHYEWSWDGSRLWILQRDQESTAQGVTPDAPRLSAKPIDSESFRVLQTSINFFTKFSKVQCLELFKNAGLSPPRVFILPGEHLPTEERHSKQLVTDLKLLAEAPFVIRTDVLTEDLEKKLLRPRTDSLTSASEALQFVDETALQLRNEGMLPTDYCFLLHRFIPSKASAWAFATPDDQRVRIDSIWGLPDGLTYFAHDSFEVDTRTNQVTKKKIRCKEYFIRPQTNGDWKQERCAAPWDWKQSLEEPDLLSVAKATHDVAHQIENPCLIMFFVGIPAEADYPPILPWFLIQNETPQQPDRSSALYLGKRFLVRSNQDLNNLQNQIAEHVAFGAIRLEPREELLRSPEFINQVADLAVQKNLPVELSGSLLSHAYYVLIQKGVRVRCRDPLQLDRRTLRFGKLVRDEIPTRIERHGEFARIAHVKNKDLLTLLKEKAVEEAWELVRSSDSHSMEEELADLLQIIESIAEVSGIGSGRIEQLMVDKRKKRGGFEQGVVLVETLMAPLIGNLHNSISDIDSSQKRKEIALARALGVRELERRPRVKGRSTLRLPNTPPPNQNPLVFYFNQLKISLTVRYGKNAIEVSIAQASEVRSEDKQLYLFPEDSKSNT